MVEIFDIFSAAEFREAPRRGHFRVNKAFMQLIRTLPSCDSNMFDLLSRIGSDNVSRLILENRQASPLTTTIFVGRNSRPSMRMVRRRYSVNPQVWPITATGLSGALLSPPTFSILTNAIFPDADITSSLWNFTSQKLHLFLITEFNHFSVPS